MSSEEKSPEPTPEDTGTQWLTMAEAAGIIGVGERAARDWVKRYTIPTRGERPVMVAEGAIIRKLAELGRSPRQSPETSREAPGSDSEPIDAAYRVRGESDDSGAALVPLSSIMEQAESWADRYAAMAERNESLALEVGQLRERTDRQASDLVAAHDRIAELEAQISQLGKPPEVVPDVDNINITERSDFVAIRNKVGHWRWWPFRRRDVDG